MLQKRGMTETDPFNLDAGQTVMQKNENQYKDIDTRGGPCSRNYLLVLELTKIAASSQDNVNVMPNPMYAQKDPTSVLRSSGRFTSFRWWRVFLMPIYSELTKLFVTRLSLEQFNIHALRTKVDPEFRGILFGGAAQPPPGPLDCSGFTFVKHTVTEFLQKTPKKTSKGATEKAEKLTLKGMKPYENPVGIQHILMCMSYAALANMLQAISQYGYDPDLENTKGNLLKNVYLK